MGVAAKEGEDSGLRGKTVSLHWLNIGGPSWGSALPGQRRRRRSSSMPMPPSSAARGSGMAV